MAKAPKQRVSAKDLPSSEVTSEALGDMVMDKTMPQISPEEKALYEQMMRESVNRSLDESYARNAPKLAGAPGMLPAETDERMIPDLTPNESDPFLSGDVGWQDTASSRELLRRPTLPVPVRGMAPIGRGAGFPAGLRPGGSSHKPSGVAVMRKPVAADMAYGAEALMGPTIPSDMSGGTLAPGPIGRLPVVGRNPYETQRYAFEALLSKFFTPSEYEVGPYDENPEPLPIPPEYR